MKLPLFRLSCAALVLCGGVLPAMAQSYHVAKSITLGGEGRWDYVVFDAVGRRLFIAREPRVMIAEPDTVAEIDAAAMKIVRQWPIAPCESPTGLAIDRVHHRLFSGCRNKLMAISDVPAGKLVTTLPIGEGVDGCGFDPGTQLAFASNGDGTLTVVHEDTPARFRAVANVATRKGART